MKTVVCGFLAVVLMSANASAAMVSLDGEASDFWESHSLVYGRVESATEVGPSRYRVRIRPVATLVGSLQCVFVETLDAVMFVGQTSTMSSPPEAGSHYIMLIYGRKNSAGGFVYFIPSGPIRFMPSRQAVAKVSSIDDAVVYEIAEAIRKAREEGIRKRAQEERADERAR